MCLMRNGGKYERYDVGEVEEGWSPIYSPFKLKFHQGELVSLFDCMTADFKKKTSMKAGGLTPNHLYVLHICW